VGGQRKAGAEIFQRGNGFQALLRIGGHRFRMRRQQPGIGLMMRTANAAAQLVQLGEAKMVGAFDDDGVGGMSIPVSMMVVHTSTLKRW
jgi:hypothetical protein